MGIGRGILTALVYAAWAGQAWAGDPGHTCRISDEEQKRLSGACVGDRDQKPDALLSKIKGLVLKSSGGPDFSPVVVPTPLAIGDSVMTKNQSSAELVLGVNCRYEIGPNASLVIRPTAEGCACAALLQEQPGPPPVQAGSGGAFGATLLAAGAVGAGAFLLIRPAPASP